MSYRAIICILLLSIIYVYVCEHRIEVEYLDGGLERVVYYTYTICTIVFKRRVGAARVVSMMISVHIMYFEHILRGILILR